MLIYNKTIAKLSKDNLMFTFLLHRDLTMKTLLLAIQTVLYSIKLIMKKEYFTTAFTNNGIMHFSVAIRVTLLKSTSQCYG